MRVIEEDKERAGGVDEGIVRCKDVELVGKIRIVDPASTRQRRR